MPGAACAGIATTLVSSAIERIQLTLTVSGRAIRRLSVVVLRRLPELRIGADVVLDPELRVLLGEQAIHFGARGPRLVLVIHVRQRAQCTLGRVVVEVSREQHWACPRQFDQQRLVTGGVAWCGLENNGSVAEYIVIARELDGLAVLERAVGRECRTLARL